MSLDKESILELQKLDCNCNDCKFMVRDFEKFKTSTEFHYKMQLNYFNIIRDKLVKAANFWKKIKNDLERYNDILTEADNMKFVFDKSTVSINYGKCSKFEKDVSFIPNVCQIETQKCFKHRKDE